MSKFLRQDSRSPSSSLSQTTIFNVGGRRFEISNQLLNQYPTTQLASYIKAAQQQKEIFLDHNPEAFSVIMDYLRYGGKLLVPKSVCAEVVRLQLKHFGLPYDEKQVEEDGDGLPSYETLDMKNKNHISHTVNSVIEGKIGVLVENFIFPMVLDHARAGHGKFDIYLLDSKIQPSQVATTIDDSVPIEWVFLTSKSLEFGSDSTKSYFGSSKSSEAPETEEDQLENMVRGFRDISQVHKDALLSAIEKNKERQRLRKSDLPDVAFIIQETVMGYLEDCVVKRASILKCVAKREDLTVRRENDFGLLESTNILCVKLSLKLV